MNERKVHCHRGKSSEAFLDKTVILEALNVLRGQIIVDAGCGNGYMSKAFSKMVSNTGKVFAFDPDREAIETLRAETKGSNIEAIEADITKTIPMEGSSTDLIYVSTVLHGFSKDEVESFQKEAKRLLKPKGRLAIVEIQKRSTPFGPPLGIRFSPEELRQIIRLSAETLVEIGPYFYMQIFENTK
jgi:ubiquinone/menaquinone biosynthesis C-methylase UbiE